MGMRERYQLRVQAIQSISQDSVAVSEHEGMGEVVDILTRTREVNEFADGYKL